MLTGRTHLCRLIGLMVLAVACGGGDGGTGPNSVTFPPLDASAIAENCIRGNTTVGDDKTGSVTATDCDQAVGAYWETWRFRVATARTVTFRVDGPQFDPVLLIAEITISNGDIAGAVVLDGDDDTNGDDPELTIDLVPDTDYMIVILGYDYTETGSYTLHID